MHTFLHSIVFTLELIVSYLRATVFVITDMSAPHVYE
jgi:hypothetical protein